MANHSTNIGQYSWFSFGETRTNASQGAGRLGTVIGVTSLLRTIIKTLYIQGGPQKMQKLNEYPTTKSVNYEFIRA